MKPGRNDKCTCGSGKKYKNCCMKNEQYIPNEVDEDSLLDNVTKEDCEHATLLENIHFEDRECKCENCLDLQQGNCEGNGYTTRDEVMDCMIKTAVRTRMYAEKAGVPLIMTNI